LSLLLAVHGERDDDVANLLAEGTDVNLGDSDGITPLMASAMNGNIVIARMLLNAGADPSVRNRWEMTAYDIAMFHGYTALAALLNEQVSEADAALSTRKGGHGEKKQS
jgi:ankyrin repeat protein